jgi:hypothetical protein
LPADGVRRRGDARLQRIVGRRVFYVFVYCADHKTLAKQLAVERRVKRAAQREKSAGAVSDRLDCFVRPSSFLQFLFILGRLNHKDHVATMHAK